MNPNNVRAKRNLRIHLVQLPNYTYMVMCLAQSKVHSITNISGVPSQHWSSTVPRYWAKKDTFPTLAPLSLNS